ncbi:COG3904 family protein [Mangrovicoccus algicola]|uniref:Clp protease n=1 Tax=Mangrovicoccus algicola TaxID=2771008 RepID=A0A8J7CIY3_9RHOB|nr:hypothetical protein [Mangrovicoccus algicola]MBE3640155.1 hypothetical protein [Mangrovicoccus algicola]
MSGAAARPRGPGIRRVMTACIVAQVLIGAAVVIEAGGLLDPGRWRGPALPGFDPSQPVGPDDQTRRYRPRDVPAAPGTMRPDPAPGQPLPDLSGLPASLRIETVARGDETLLSLTGTIDQGAAARFRDRLEAMEPPDAILLHSPGGVVAEALEIGREIRARDLPTRMVAGAACLSACPYMLAGGTVRSVSRDARVGVHQSYYDRNAYLPLFVGVASIQEGEAEAMRFLQEMGVDPLLRIPALETPADAIYILTEEELTGYDLATALTD